METGGTEADSGQVTWSNGDYTIIGSTDHFAYDAVGQGTTVNTDAHEDLGDVYRPDGVFLFRETFHSVEH